MGCLRVFCCALITLFICSCTGRSNEFRDIDALQSYMDEKKERFHKETVHEDIKVEFEYIPPVLLEGDSSYLYFKLNMSYKDKEFLAQLPSDHYSHMVSVFSFRMQEHVHLKDATDKVLPVDVYYIPTYGMSNKNELTIVFKRDDLKDMTDEHVDLVLDQPGLLTYTFNTRFNRKDLDFNPTISKI